MSIFSVSVFKKKKKSLLVLLIYISTFFYSVKATLPSLGKPKHTHAHSGNSMLKTQTKQKALH